MTAGRGRPRVPPLVAGAGVVGVGLLSVPIVGLLVRTPWAELPALLSSEVALQALWLSLIASVLAALSSLAIGVPLAWLLVRVPFPGRGLVRGLVLLPLVLPPVVAGAALLFALGRRGLVGAPLYEATGLVLPFSLGGVVVAATFVSMPLMVIAVEGALRGVDPRFEGAAAALGASPWTVFRRVTLPMTRPGIVGGLLLTWARALGEFGATVTFAGSLQGRTQTLPLAIYVGLQSDRDAAVAMSLILVVLSLGVLVLLRDRWWSSG